MYLSNENFDTTVVERIAKIYQNNTNVIERVKVKNSDISSNIEEKMHNAFHYLHKFTTYKKITKYDILNHTQAKFLLFIKLSHI